MISYDCKKCGFHTINKRKYTVHLKSNKHNDIKKIYKLECVECDKKFCRHFVYKQHIKSKKHTKNIDHYYSFIPSWLFD